MTPKRRYPNPPESRVLPIAYPRCAEMGLSYGGYGLSSGVASVSGASPTDVHLANVVSLLHFEDAPGTITPADAVAGVVWSVSPPSGVRSVVSTAQKKYGNSSLARPHDPGGNVAGGIYTTVSMSYNQPWTAEFYINFTSFPYPGNSRFFCVGPGASFGQSVILEVKSDMKVAYNGFSGAASSFTAGTGVWYFFAVCFTGSQVVTYLDGSQILTAAFAGTAVTSVVLSPASAYGYNGDFHNSYTDEFRMTKNVCRYTGNFTPPTAPFPYA